MGIVDYDSTRGQYIFGHTVRDESKDKNNYDGSRRVNAAYGMLELPLARSLKVIGGVRVETTLIEIASMDSTLDKGNIDEVDLLPSLNVVYNLTDRMNLRAAYSNTLARPTFREISPFASFDFDIGDFRIGNPNLDRTRIANYDMRWEWFVRPGEILAVSLFYKDMTNPIEEAIIGGTNGQLQYQNVAQATVRGAEFEIRQGLDFVAGFTRNLSLGMNLSLVDSNVDIPDTELTTRLEIDSTASATRELQGQSPYILNADLSYDNLRSGTTAALYFNVFGGRLSNVSLGGTPDVFERSSPQLDFTLSQRLPGRWSAKVSAKNLLDSSYKLSHSFQGDEFIYQEYKRGRSFSLGVSYSP
jgi:TonB-dependent receptor